METVHVQKGSESAGCAATQQSLLGICLRFGLVPQRRLGRRLDAVVHTSLVCPSAEGRPEYDGPRMAEVATAAGRPVPRIDGPDVILGYTQGYLPVQPRHGISVEPPGHLAQVLEVGRIR